MWMAYAETKESSEVADLSSAVIVLQRRFERLAFDAEHEAVYGMNRFYSAMECENLAANYLQAYDVCDKYLLSKISIDRLVQNLQELRLTRFIFDLEPHLPSHLQQYLLGISSDGDEEEEEEDGTGETNDVEEAEQ